MNTFPKNSVSNSSDSCESMDKKVGLIRSSHHSSIISENTYRSIPKSSPIDRNCRSPYSVAHAHLSESSSVLRRTALLHNMEISHSLAKTPKSNERVNPFEKKLLSSLGQSLWSPTIFENVHMGETPPPASWTLDQVANLFPKNFEDSPSSHTNAFLVDSFTEAKAQADIDRFFNSGPIAPSPDEITPRPRGLLQKEFNNSKEVYVDNGNTSTTTVWTNTELSLPPNLAPELEIALKPYFQSHMISEIEPENPDLNSSNVSTTSVRRRLDLSFGESSFPEDSSSSSTTTTLPYGDPFGNNHRVSSPPPPESFSNMLSFSSPCVQDTSTSEVESQFLRLRCEFTPNSMDCTMNSPNITPIGSEKPCISNGTKYPGITPIAFNSTHQDKNKKSSCGRGLKRKSMLHSSTKNIYSSTPTGRRSSIVKFARSRARKIIRLSTEAKENMDYDNSVKKQSQNTRKSYPTTSTIVVEKEFSLTSKSENIFCPVNSSAGENDKKANS